MIPTSNAGELSAKLNDVVVVSGCNQAYFPLAKGLFSSLLPLAQSKGLRLAFVDVGCDQDALDWLFSQGIEIKRLSSDLYRRLQGKVSGGQLAQICRPFLPEILLDAPIIGWMDADMWVQDLLGFHAIISASVSHRDKILVSPEQHFTYSHVMDNEQRRKEIVALNEPLFGLSLASEMQKHPVYNTGFFIASRTHPFWREWSEMVLELYVGRAGQVPPNALHFAEQNAFNYVVMRDSIIPHHIDPLYNYLCLWSIPFRDETGTVRLSATPASPVGILHLAGGWRFFGRRYMRAKLLYKNGDNLSIDELNALRKIPVTANRHART